MSEETKTPLVAPVAAEQDKAPVATDAAKPKEQDSERFAALARKEKGLRAQYAKFQQEKAAFEAQKVEAAKPKPEPTNWDAKLAEDPFAVIKSAATTIEKLQAEIAELKSGQTKSLEEVKNNQNKAYEQAVKQVAREVKLLVDGDEAYETIKATGSQDAVVELIKQTYADDGIILSAEEAATQIEEYLLEEALMVAKLKKVQAKLSPPEEQNPATKTPNKAQTQPTITTKTLTHSVNASTKPLSKSDVRQRAILAFQGQLK